MYVTKSKTPANVVFTGVFIVSTYRRWDSNPHGFKGHWILSPARLPVPPLLQIFHQIKFLDLGHPALIRVA